MKSVLLVFMLTTLSFAQTPKKDSVDLQKQVSSADHEIQEGYFAFGEDLTLIAKPGSELYNFLSSHRGQKIKIHLEKSTAAELSKLEREGDD